VRAWGLLVVVLLLAGCGGPAPGTPTGPTTATPPPAHAADRFDGEAAHRDAEAQVLSPDGSVRYRVPGTPGNDEAATIIADDLAAAGWNVTWDRWNGTYRCLATPMHNVVAERAGTSGKVVILGAHYDTRPIAESDPDPANRTQPIPGANDGASGVAVLLELARVLPPTADAVRLVFFDAEDGGDMGDGCTDWLLGSRHHAENMTLAQRQATKAMVLVDLVGDPGLRLPRELSTHVTAGRAVQDRIYAIANGLGHAEFINETRPGQTFSITDDHTPFIEESIPAVDIIHLVAGRNAFPEWHHTRHDDLAHVSARSLEAVGGTLVQWLVEGAQSGP
jgi:hypothetical protein